MSHPTPEDSFEKISFVFLGSSWVLTKWPELGKSKKSDEGLGQRGLARVGEGTEGCMTTMEEENIQGARGGLDRGCWC